MGVKGEPWMAYWGKAGRLDPLASHHPLVFHSLDVAACGQAYLDRAPAFLVFPAHAGMTRRAGGLCAV